MTANYIDIASRPELEEADGQVRVRIPLSARPSEAWRRSFLKRQEEANLGDLSLVQASLVLVVPPSDLKNALLAVDTAIQETNRRYEQEPVVDEIDNWWSQRDESEESGPSAASHPANTSTKPDSPTPAVAGQSIDQPESSAKPAPPAAKEPKSNTWGNWSLGLGIVSVFFGGGFGLIPIVTVVVSVVALTRSIIKPWKAWVGLALGGVYTIVYLYNFGYLG